MRHARPGAPPSHGRADAAALWPKGPGKRVLSHCNETSKSSETPGGLLLRHRSPERLPLRSTALARDLPRSPVPRSHQCSAERLRARAPTRRPSTEGGHGMGDELCATARARALEPRTATVKVGRSPTTTMSLARNKSDWRSDAMETTDDYVNG
eukprot:2790830-Alexandrium_andersonii.AAC.1